MFKVKALQEFTYKEFSKIKNLERHDETKKEKGKLYAEDVFECTKEMVDYLTGECGYTLVKVIEVVPEEAKEEPKIEATVEFSEKEAEPKATVKKTKKTKKK